MLPKEQFVALIEMLHQEQQGQLFLAMKDDVIVAGSLMLFYGKQMVYLYGATDRSFGNIGAHYRLTYEIMQWGHRAKKTQLDLLGIAPVGFEEEHYLSGVTRFKQSFGGTTISYVGNYDLVFSPVLYKTFKFMRGK